MPPFAKREIKNSFIKLLTERPISQITVKDIVEDCGVNRNSFYYHFQDIPSLLEEIIVEMTAKVIILLPPINKIPDDICLVNIQISFFPYFLKRLDAYRQSSIVHFFHHNPYFCYSTANIQLLSETKQITH